MTEAWVAVAVTLVVFAAGCTWWLTGRRKATPVLVRAKSSTAKAAIATSADDVATPSPAISTPAVPDLAEVLGSGELGLYVPVDDGGTFLELAGPRAPTMGTVSQVPTQLARLAVTGQAGVDAMLKAGELSGRLVTVDSATAQAIRTGTMVTDKAGEMLGIIRGDNARWAGLTRIKPVSGNLVKSASSGPAVLSAIAMQAQLANVEKAIASVSATVDAMWEHVQKSELHAMQSRREVLVEAYRTAVESEQMTQAIWDEIQHLGGPLRDDVRKADEAVQQAVASLSGPESRGVSGRLRWLDETAPRLQGAVAAAAAARRSMMQFSTLRLWWLAVSDDPSLASRQQQMLEQLHAIPDHHSARAQVEALVAEVSELRRLHKISAPRKHKRVAPSAERAREALAELPWVALAAPQQIVAARPS